MAVGKRPQTLAQYVVRNLGTWDGQKVITFIISWEIARSSLGKSPISLEEYRDWWKVSERTAYREQALFRQAFPDHASPEELLNRADKRHESVQQMRWS